MTQQLGPEPAGNTSSAAGAGCLAGFVIAIAVPIVRLLRLLELNPVHFRKLFPKFCLLDDVIAKGFGVLGGDDESDAG
jgi:hypothetical protein